jgi:hypothetical protein
MTIVNAKIIRDITSRLDRLEKSVFGTGRGQKNAKPEEEGKGFTGAAGGIRLLIAKSFFRQARTAAAVRSELEKRGYFYRIQVVQTALNRLSQRSGPLSAFERNGKKMYVERK